MGVSTATLSLFLTSSYTGDNETVAQKAMQFLELGAAREQMAASPPICMNVGNTKKILAAVKMAHEGNEIHLVYGPAGCGKSTALKYYAKKTSGTVYVEVDATTGSHRNVLISVLEAMGEIPKNRPTAQIMREILSMLKGTNRLLLIDEAQHLNERAFDTLRAINDKAGVGIIFSGNRGILKRMFGRFEMEYDQLFSRFGGFCEVQNYYSTEDISGIYAGVQLDGESVNHLRKVANQKGGMRRMDKQYRLAANIAKALRQKLTLPLLLEADKRLSIVKGKN